MEKKKGRKKLVIILLIIFAVACIGAYCLYLSQINVIDENHELVLEAGQEITYAKITSISGNEMDYIVLQSQIIDLNGTSSDRREHGSGRQTGGEKSDALIQGRQMLSEMSNIGENFSDIDRRSSGEIPSDRRGMQSGGMPDMSIPFSGDIRVNTENQEEKPSSGGNNINDTQNRTITTYTETKEIGKIQIPVGTEVETKLGTVTTFSRLSNGDIIQMLLQKDHSGNNVLVKIWIVE